MKKKQYHHGNLRANLLKTAARMISQEGLEKVTMRALSQKVGVSRTAAYRHFKDKADLLCAIAEDGFKRLARRLKKINGDTSEDSFIRFQQIGIQYIEFAIEFPGYYRLMFGHEIIQQRRTAALLETSLATFNELLKAIEVCQKEDKIETTDPYLLANTVWAWAHGLSMLQIDGQIDTSGAGETLPTLVTQDLLSDGESQQKLIRFSMETLAHGMKK